MKLLDCQIGKLYKIIDISTENKRLTSLGFVKGREVYILFKSKQNIVVNLLGSCYSLAPSLASLILIEEV